MLSATYTDRGGKGIGPLTSTDTLALRPAKVYAEDFNYVYDLTRGKTLLGRHGSYALLKGIDLTGINAVTAQWKGPGQLEVRLGSAKGPQIGFSRMDSKDWQEITLQLKPTAGIHDLYVVFVNETKRFTPIELGWLQFHSGDGQAK